MPDVHRPHLEDDADAAAHADNLAGFLGAVAIYYGDLVLMEPKLLSMYDEILPQIDRALGESPAAKDAVK